ncbi:unnamed protein product, partial [Ixodes persulcatus]
FQAQVRRKAIESLGIAYAELGMRPTPSKKERTIANAILGAYCTKNRDDQFAVEKVYQTYLVPVELSASYRMTLLYRLYLVLNEESLLCFTDLHKNIASALKRLKALLHDVITAPLDQLRRGKSAMPETSHGRNNDFGGEYSQVFSAFHSKKELCADLANALEEHRPIAEVQQKIVSSSSLFIDSPANGLHCVGRNGNCQSTIISSVAQDHSSVLSRVVRLEARDHGSKSFQVFVEILCKYNDIVQVDEAALPFQTRQHGVHDTLEGGWCCTKSERHHFEFVQPVGSDEGSFLLVAFVDFNLPKTTLQVHRRKISGVAQSVQRVVDAGEWIDVLRLLSKVCHDNSCTSFLEIRYASCDANSFFKEQLDAAFQKSFAVHGCVGCDHDENTRPRRQVQWSAITRIAVDVVLVSTGGKTGFRSVSRLTNSFECNIFQFHHRIRRLQPRRQNLGISPLQHSCSFWSLYISVDSKIIFFIAFEFDFLALQHDVMEVRTHFSRKLCKYLNSLRLPVWFSAILAYAFCEPSGDLKRSAEETLQRNFAARHAAISKYRVKERNGRLYNLHPDYVLPHAVHLMAHDPEFTYHEDLAALSRIKMCLFFLMKPMFKSSPGLDVEFYVKLLTSIKQVRDRQNPSDEEAHLVSERPSAMAKGIKLPTLAVFMEQQIRKILFSHVQLQRLNEETYLTKELCFTPPKNQSVDMSAYGLKLAKRPRVNLEDLLRSESPGESATTSLEDWESDG